jgi:hypothetical protein
MRRLLVVLVVTVAFALVPWPNLAWSADVGTCEPAKTPAEKKEAAHIFFEIAQGKKLLTALTELKTSREQNRLLEERIKIKEEMIGLWRLQAQAAEKALDTVARALAGEKSRGDILALSAQKWQQEAARAKAERVWWMIGGIVGGVLIVGGAILVGWVVAGR